MDLKELWNLFLTFAKVGATTFGGGYAMLPILEREVVEKRGWATEEELMNYFAVGQCTPGVIAVNTATFIGYKKRGIIGGVAATLGVIAPSMIIIMIIAAFIQNFADLPVVVHAFAGIRAVVAVLIIDAVVRFFKAGCKDWFGVVVFLLSLLLAGTIGISSIYVVIGAIIAGLIAGRCKKGGIE